MMAPVGTIIVFMAPIAIINTFCKYYITILTYLFSFRDITIVGLIVIYLWVHTNLILLL